MHGFYEPMRQLVERALAEGFVRPMLGDLMLFDTEIDRLIARMEAAELPALERWIDQT